MDVASLAIDALEVSRSTSPSIILILPTTHTHTSVNRVNEGGDHVLCTYWALDHSVEKRMLLPPAMHQARGEEGNKNYQPRKLDLAF